jgi:hypothetical protein
MQGAHRTAILRIGNCGRTAATIMAQHAKIGCAERECAAFFLPSDRKICHSAPEMIAIACLTVGMCSGGTDQ